MNITEKNSKIVAALFIAVYIICRMVFDSFWQPYFYFSYLFEVVFVALAFYVYRKNFSLNYQFSKIDSVILLSGGISGALVAKGSGLMHLIIPFDLTAPLTLVFLLFIGPMLEEFIFRMALWDSFKTLVKNSWFVIAITSLLFSFAHFIAFWSTPPEYKPFIYYQTSYTFALALALGWQRERTQSLAAPIMLHFLFNLGFYAGCWL